MFSDINGQYGFETILPGYYANRPRHIHVKITTPNNEVLISQLYFANDPFCASDPWCQDAGDRVIDLVENLSGLYGQFDFIMDSSSNGIIPGDVNLDGNINVLDIVRIVGIILDDYQANDFEMYAADVNGDNAIDVIDIVSTVSIILGRKLSFQVLESGSLNITTKTVNLNCKGEIAGIQIHTRGDYIITKNCLMVY